MSENSKIEWTDHTFNPWTGCTKVSPGCANCYAEGWAKRSGIVKWGPGAPRRRTSEANWKLPIRWNKMASVHPDAIGTDWEKNSRPRVFCASLADWLDDEVPIAWLADLLALIQDTPNLDWLLLTKRPENWEARMLEVIRHELSGGCVIGDAFQIASRRSDKLPAYVAGKWKCVEPPPNVWLGTTVENQAMAEKRIWELLAIPSKLRFLSCEPLLEAIDLGNMAGINWVICGGESGPSARPMEPWWARSLHGQCAKAGTPFFMKQMGGTRKPFAAIPDDLNIRQFPK